MIKTGWWEGLGTMRNLHSIKLYNIAIATGDEIMDRSDFLILL